MLGLTRAHPLLTSRCLWHGLAWRDQPVRVPVRGGEPVLERGDRGQGLVVQAFTPEADPPAGSAVAELTLGEVLQRCPAGTLAVVDPLRPPYVTFTAADLQDPGSSATEPVPHLVVSRAGRVRGASTRRPALHAALHEQLGPGELVSCSDDQHGQLLYVTSRALPADLGAAREVVAAHHPVPPLFVAPSPDLPPWLAQRIADALASAERTS